MTRYLSLFAVGLAAGYLWGWLDGVARFL
ncbi:hypothetical protein FEA48_05765 [Pseudomonas nitroreducens]|uniref:Uncharacterized protein n=1 Tax=Pseudomonas nitroreducens TaxID=46680 RepID=A0A5R9AL55_PSENT|nr:hypothetical protein FEA48_05765 [Pseudomonas nitroreducens]